MIQEMIDFLEAESGYGINACLRGLLLEISPANVDILRNTFKKVYDKYEIWLLPFFEEIGYLDRSPYEYSTIFGICYYYKMNG